MENAVNLQSTIDGKSNSHQNKPVVKTMKIMDGGLKDPRMQALLSHHFSSARAMSPPASAHALDLNGLKKPDAFWSGWDGERVIAIGALNRISTYEGEIKSMHTAESYRKKGLEMVRNRISTQPGNFYLFS